MNIETKLRQFAKIHDIEFVPDSDMLEIMNKRLEAFGLVLCPCHFITTPPNYSQMLRHARCPCVEGINEVHLTGACHCGLFRKE